MDRWIDIRIEQIDYSVDAIDAAIDYKNDNMRQVYRQIDIRIAQIDYSDDAIKDAIYYENDNKRQVGDELQVGS